MHEMWQKSGLSLCSEQRAPRRSRLHLVRRPPHLEDHHVRRRVAQPLREVHHAGVHGGGEEGEAALEPGEEGRVVERPGTGAV